MSEKLRWGIIGCAAIAKRAVIPGIKNSQYGEVVAIASRDKAKAEETAQEFGIPTSYGSYEELLADPNIDAVYIPLPNHLHKPWTIRAAEAGKHVLCEKPLALGAREAEEMKEACAKAGVQLAEAFMYRHHPRYHRIKEIIASGEIGEIRGIHGAFTFNNAKDYGNVRYVKEWGGGSLYDVGCYPLSAARLILEQEPVAVTVVAQFSEQHGNVDMMASGLVEFPGDVALTFDCGMWAGGRNILEIVGSDGSIFVPKAYLYNKQEEGDADFFVRTAQGERREKAETLDVYALQADDFALAVFGRQPQKFPADDAVQNMKVLEACLQSAEQRRTVELN